MPAQLVTNNVQGRIAPGYSPANDPESWGSRLAGIFDGTAKVVGDIMTRREEGGLQSAQANKLRAETDVLQTQQAGYKLYGQTLAKVFQDGGTIQDAMQLLSPLVPTYNLDPVTTLKSTASIVAAMPDTDGRKQPALEFLNNAFPIYSDKSFGIGDTATGPDAKRVFDATQATQRRGQDMQLEGMKYQADVGAASRAEVAALKAEAAENKPGKPWTPDQRKTARQEVERAIQRAIGLAPPPDKKSAGAWQQQNKALLGSPEYVRALDTADELYRAGVSAPQAGFQAAARVLNGRKWNGSQWVVDPGKAAQFGANNVGVDTTTDIPASEALAGAFMPTGDLPGRDPGRFSGSSSAGGDTPPMNNIGGLPKVTTAEDYRRLPPNAKYIDDEGNVRTKRAQ